MKPKIAPHNHDVKYLHSLLEDHVAFTGAALKSRYKKTQDLARLHGYLSENTEKIADVLLGEYMDLKLRTEFIGLWNAHSHLFVSYSGLRNQASQQPDPLLQSLHQATDNLVEFFGRIEYDISKEQLRDAFLTHINIEKKSFDAYKEGKESDEHIQRARGYKYSKKIAKLLAHVRKK